jgi:hypothetical protein
VPFAKRNLYGSEIVVNSPRWEAGSIEKPCTVRVGRRGGSVRFGRLDAELAALYGATTARLNQQVRRNLERFPEDFMFQLTAAEYAL